MSFKCLAHWKFSDENVYPIFITSFTTILTEQQKTVIMVACDDQVVSLSVPSIDRALSVMNVPLEFSRCDLPYTGLLRELRASDSTAICLASDGKMMVYDFTQGIFVKIMDCSHIRHVKPGNKQGEWIIIRQSENGEMLLEVIEISENLTKHNILKRYELLVECSDNGTRYLVHKFSVNATNDRFLGNFLAFTKLSIGDEIFLIAINNNLYWLQQQDSGESDMIVVRCFASSIMDIDFFENSLCLTVLLEAGLLVVFRQSSNPEALIVTSSSVYLHAPIEAYAFDKNNNALLYSNGVGMHRVHFHYSEETKQIDTEMEDIHLRGVLAITLLDTKSLALLVTENNQFYYMNCKDKMKINQTEASKMFLLPGNVRNVSHRVTRRLTEEIELDKRLEEALQIEQAKFDVLALHRNRSIFGGLSRLTINFQNDMPPRKAPAFVIGMQGENVCLFASVKIEINLGIFQLLLQQKRWLVSIEYNGNTSVRPVHETFTKDGVLHAVVFVHKSDLMNGLPNFHVILLAAVRHGNENLLLTIPIPYSGNSVEEDATNLIQQAGSWLSAVENRVALPIIGILSQNNPYPMEKRKGNGILTYSIRNEQSKTKAISFSSVLESNDHDSWWALDEAISIRWHGKRSVICLKTCHPVALDLVKRYLLDEEEYGAEIELIREKLKGQFLELQAVTDPSLIVQLYRRIRNSDSIDVELSLNLSNPS
ncbi:uncharacterized protein LOC128723865 [Anopheles nili]|uniref:uncharacterized protein LOC128723865 n=1 Tax=Anopheles nili TaxID=185578 RepID=UPI00237B6129|nr:uncharacterized protein LOC128723865 [Anopheles nili]